MRQPRDVLETKSYPEEYPADAVAVLNAMSFTNGEGVALAGSASLKSQQYAGDYDGFEIVKMNEPSDQSALQKLVKKFKSIVRNLKTKKTVFIMDFKSGVIDDWKIVPDSFSEYDASKSRAKAEELHSKGILTRKELAEARDLLKDGKEGYFGGKAELKVHIVRWTVPEILRGSKTLRDGRTYTLEQGFSSKSMTKLDCIGWVQGSRFTEFSMLYQFRNKGRVLNPDTREVATGLAEDMAGYIASGDYYKALKRWFAVAKLRNDMPTIHKLTDLFNSDLGRIYQIIADINALVELLEEGKGAISKIRYEIDQFRNRLANVYSIQSFTRKSLPVMKQLELITQSKDRVKMAQGLVKIEEVLSKVLQDESKRYI